MEEEALAAWERSLSLDPNADAVRKKIEDGRERLRRVKSDRSKASQ
jgi:cytochrome c-type biogenesis protein CcmH/NrfG